ncbi:MAG TPA: hypothetical protein V6C76_12010 [Drouetiella sp.]
MSRKLHKFITSMLALSLLSTALPPVQACAPGLAYAVLVNGSHPDLPLKFFALGKIGIVQPGWAKSYLVVAYRYLIDKPLTEDEKQGVISLWHKRITSGYYYSTAFTMDERDRYLKLRATATGASSKSTEDLFFKMRNVGDSAIHHARLTLQKLVSKYKPGSSEVLAWVRAEDGILGISSKKIVVPAALPLNAPLDLRNYRTYQIGAANFHLCQYDSALKAFGELAQSADTEDKSLASYMVLRSKAAMALLNDRDQKKTENELLSAASQATSVTKREEILDLLRPLNYMNKSTADAVKSISADLLSGTDKRFGGDVGDLTFLLDGNALHPELANTVESATKSSATQVATADLARCSSLADWILTVQDSADSYGWDDSPEEKAKHAERSKALAKHALDMWRQTKSRIWLVAALTTNGCREDAQHDLFEAAQRERESSPAYLTCQFYVADALLAKAQNQKAHSMLSLLLERKDLPPTTRNLYRMQLASSCPTDLEYLRYSIETATEVLPSSTDIVTPKFLETEKQTGWSNKFSAFDANVAADISRNAPLSSWVALAQNKYLPESFRTVLLRTVWTRAAILQRNDVLDSLAPQLAKTNPVLSPAVSKFEHASTPTAKQFAVANLILRNFGMTPYLTGGVERHGEAISEFDDYNNNFWVPLALVEEKKDEYPSITYNDTIGFTGGSRIKAAMDLYNKKGLARRLSNIQKNQAITERRLILKNHPSKYFGDIVLNWAKSHPTDPDVPELLYKIVKLPKWTEESAVGSEYSRKAYIMLHSKYAGSKWSKKAVCYY